MGKLHIKKIQHKYFEDILKNGKKFEIRKNDCDYQVGDFVILAEYDGEKPMNNSALVEITYVLKDIPQYGLDKDYCIFGFVERWLSLEGMEEERSEKLRRAIEILQRIYDFKVVDKTDTYNGWYEILTSDLAMTREKLTKKEFEILKNVLQSKEE